MTTTLFVSPVVSSYPDDAPDPFFARLSNEFQPQTYYNVLYYRLSSVALNTGETFGINPSGANATKPWVFVMLRVIGHVVLETTGTDVDGATPIAGYTPSYGTSVFPGVLLLSSINAAPYIIRGAADGSVVEVFTAVCS